MKAQEMMLLIGKANTYSKNRLSGFSLVELLVVLAIIGLVLSVSVPAFGRYAAKSRLKVSVRQVVNLASYARTLSISSREEHALVIDPDERMVKVINLSSGEALEQVVKLPSSIDIVLEVGSEPTGEVEVVFRPSGALASRTTEIVLTQGERERRVTITGPTGAVTVK